MQVNDMRQTAKLTARERIEAALSFQEVDRIPYSVWTHYPGTDFHPAELARVQAADAARYGFDFIKVPNNGLFMVIDYGTEYRRTAGGKPDPDKYGALVIERYGVRTAADWDSLRPLDPERGHLADQLQILRELKRHLKDRGIADLPVIPTIYSPLTTAHKLGGDRLFADLRENPSQIHRALETLTETTIRYAEKCLQLGAEGFFFASQLSNYQVMDEATYEVFGEPYDLRVFESFQGRTFFDVVHIHGEQAMFGKLASYPAHCLSWHDRWIGPSLQEARARTDKCLLGGIDEERAFGVFDDAAFAAHVREALELGGERGFILGPGCTAYPNMPEAHLQMIRQELEARNR